jgi:hypothetical protein
MAFIGGALIIFWAESRQKQAVQSLQKEAIARSGLAINTVDDLIRFWSFCGPCIEDCPSVEKYSK